MEKHACWLTATVVLAGYGLVAHADEVAVAGRAVVAQNKGAVVTVRLVVKQEFSMFGFPSDEEESVQEITGTIIDPEGLIVVSLAATDPAQLLGNIMALFDEEDEGFKTSIGDVTILLEDGEELPGKVVLRDKDLDLAFIRPKEKPEKPLPAIDLTNAATPDQFDRLILLRRLGKVAKRACAGSFPRIQAVMRKPRLLYILGAPPGTALGAPAFSMDGKYVGMVVLRSIKMSGAEGFGFGLFMEGDMNMATAVIPAKDVLEIAKQAPSAEEKEGG